MESKWHSQVRTEIVRYLKGKDFDVRTSHEGTGRVPLYYEKTSRSTFTSDVDIIAIKDGQVKYMVEVQDSIRPKDIIGIIGAINISTIYADRNATYPLKDVILFLVSKLYIKGSKKEKQAKMIQDRFQIIGGCLRDFVICLETDFKTEF